MFFNKNEKAISPVVATLVLIVVAIVGAVAVGTLLGLFSQNVGSQSHANNVSENYNSANELTMSGSTTCYPVNVLLASAFMESYPGSRVTVSQGGSGQGIKDVVAKTVDIGTTSRTLKTDGTEDYPDLVAHQIGGRGVVVIGGSGVAQTDATGVSPADMNAAYTANDATGIADITGATTLYQRAEDGSGTEEAMASWLGAPFAAAKGIDTLSAAAGQTGNEGMLAAVQGNAGAIGFVDFGYVDTDAKLGSAHILRVETQDGDMCEATSAHILSALKGDVDAYPAELVGPLMYYTNGVASPMAVDFVDFAQDPENAGYFHQVGLFALSDL